MFLAKVWVVQVPSSTSTVNSSELNSFSPIYCIVSLYTCDAHSLPFVLLLVTHACDGYEAKVFMCSTVLQPTLSGSCSMCRTTLLGSSSRRQDDPMPRRCWTRTGCPFSRELATRWLCWLLRFKARRRRPTSVAYSRTERTSTICDDDRPLRHCADLSPRQQWQSAHSAAQHQPSGTRYQRQFWTVTL